MKKGYMLADLEFIEDMLFFPELNMHIESIEMMKDGRVKINIYREDLPDNSNINKKYSITYHKKTKDSKRVDLISLVRTFFKNT